MTNKTPRLSAQRWMLILILAIAVIPFVAAWFFVKHPDLIAGRSNYGTLIIPAQSLSYDTLIGTADSASAELQQVKGRWILLQVQRAGAPCGPECQQTVYATRQIRLMLNKDIPRVQRLLLWSAPAVPLPVDLKQRDPELLQGVATGPLQEALSRVLGGPLQDGMLVLVDPFGNAMMWYPPGFDPYGVLRDLKHLLRSSQIG